MPAYAGLIGSMGLTIVLRDAYLFPLTAAFLVLALGSLFSRARSRNGYGPFALGLGASVVLLGGKFALDAPAIAHSAAGLLLAASVWNAWPRRASGGGSRSSPETFYQLGTITNEESNMTAKRRIEVFSASCPVCLDVVETVRAAACPSCEVTVLDMKEAGVAERATRLGIRSVPAVVIDGKLADCCSGGGVDEATLRAAGLGRPSA